MQDKQPRFKNGAVGDPIARFSETIGPNSISMESRSDEQLVADAHNLNLLAREREQSLYQYIYRTGARSLDVVERALFDDPDPLLRVNVLWALQDYDDDRCRKIALALMHDKDPRVQEWARVFAWELGWTREDFRRAREAKHLPERTFDETIFLHIKCHVFVRISDTNDMWGHVILSPQTLAYVYGQAMACPIAATRDHELVISKTLKGLHEDDYDHYEAFLFRGFTDRTVRDRGDFLFQAEVKRPFYLSGKADDYSQGVIDDVLISFEREGQWFLNENIEVRGKPAIEYVRGLFKGWAYVNLERIMADPNGGFLFPGNSILSTLHHPEVGKRTNAFMVGSYKGKVLDWDGDGILDLNYLKSYATARGEVDSNLDGVADIAGGTYCPRSSHQIR